MTEMIERVARAICTWRAAYFHVDGKGYFSWVALNARTNQIAETFTTQLEAAEACIPLNARAAIEAMREAPDVVIIAGAEHCKYSLRSVGADPDRVVRNVWEVMIDEVLK